MSQPDKWDLVTKAIADSTALSASFERWKALEPKLLHCKQRIVVLKQRIQQTGARMDRARSFEKRAKAGKKNLQLLARLNEYAQLEAEASQAWQQFSVAIIEELNGSEPNKYLWLVEALKPFMPAGFLEQLRQKCPALKI
jgi:hypothetical protein